MRSIARIHPFLFLIVSLMYLYRGAAIIASPEQVVRPAVILIALLLLLEFPARWISGDWDSAALLLSIFVLGVCSNWRTSLAVGIISIIVLAIGLILIRIRRIRAKLFQLNILLTMVGLIFVFSLGLPLAGTLPPASKVFSQPVWSHVDLVPVNPPPDIYYIVLDGYARADILKDLYQFDNSGFIEELESLRFVVPTRNHSNYSRTALSVTSTLNMDYTENFAPGLEEYPYWWLMSPALNYSRVRSMLEEMGYTSVAIATDWGVTNNTTADEYYAPAPVVLNDFENYFLFQTPMDTIRPLFGTFAYVQSYDAHRSLIRFQFETLAQMSSRAGPKFIFAHILAPHPPFVFDADGKPLQPSYRFNFNDANDFPLQDKEIYRQGYVAQVRYVNTQLLDMIETILHNSKTPPIIILQADHGPGMLTDFNSAENTCLAERFSPFAAYYLPGVDSSVVPNDITPVNLFRIVFNEYFSADFPLLEDRQYYSDGVFLYRQEDVTEQVDTCARQ